MQNSVLLVQVIIPQLIVCIYSLSFEQLIKFSCQKVDLKPIR